MGTVEKVVELPRASLGSTSWLGRLPAVPGPARAYQALIGSIGAAAALTAAWGTTANGGTPADLVRVLMLTVLVAALGSRRLTLGTDERIGLGGAVVFAACQDSVALAPLVAFVGTMGSSLMSRRSSLDVAFTAGQYAIAAAAAAAVFVEPQSWHEDIGLLAVIRVGLAGVIFFAVSSVIAAGLVSLARAGRLMAAWREIARRSALPQACLLSIGGLIPLILGESPAALVFVAMPLWLIVHAFRQAELAESRARQIEQMLDSQRRFVANAAHELRTPIAAIRGNAELALSEQRDQTGEIGESPLADIAAESIRLSKLVDDLLLLSQSDEQRQMDWQPIDLLDLVEGIVRRAQRIDSTVVLRLGEVADVSVNGDLGLVQQVIEELVDNARKYTPAGGQVVVSLHATRDWAEVRVCDNGVGISAEDLPFIFDRFYRAPAARAQARGAGLGLANARWIADAHGGRIEVRSAPGEGSSFSLLLPRTAARPSG